MKEYKAVKLISGLAALISAAALLSVIAFIFAESWPFLSKEGILKLIKPGEWSPISKNPQFSIYNMVATSLYIFVISIILALPVSVGTALFTTFYCPDRVKDLILRTVGILAGVPSIVMGFIGLVVVVKLIETEFNLATGESVLAGGIIVSIMIIPFILSAVAESAEIIKQKHLRDSEFMGISKEYFIRNIAMRELLRPIGIGVILAFSRVIGETMAIMMVVGNAPLFPKLLGKAETIPGLIALEMGMAEVGSMHYSALFSAGFVLLIVITAVNIFIQFLRNRGLRNEG